MESTHAQRVDRSQLPTIQGRPMSIIQGRYSLYQWLYPSFHQRGNHESHVKRADQKFEITDEGEVDEYIGVEIEMRDYGTPSIADKTNIG